PESAPSTATDPGLAGWWLGPTEACDRRARREAYRTDRRRLVHPRASERRRPRGNGSFPSPGRGRRTRSREDARRGTASGGEERSRGVAARNRRSEERRVGE